MKRKVLICGASGFIGRNVAEALAKRDDCEVYGTCLNSKQIDIPGVKMVCADLTNKDDVNSVIAGKDVLIQAAAVTTGSKDTVTRPYHHVTDNAVMNSLILRAAYDHKVSHLLFFSCSVMYQPGNKPVKESDFDAGQEIFPSYFGIGWTKVYIEKMCEFYARLGTTRFTVIRHSNIYGPHDKYDLERSHVFGATVTKVMTAKDGGKITVWGDGTEERDLLYAADLVNFVGLAIDKQKSAFELYNVGSGSCIAVKDLAARIIALSGKKLKIEYDTGKPSIKTKLCLDTAKAKKSLGWAPGVSLDEGIQKTLEWYKINIINGR